MSFQKEISFAMAALAALCILHLFPFDDGRVSLYRLEGQLRQQPELREAVANYCQTVEGAEGDRAAKYLVQMYRPSITDSAKAQRCRLVVESTSSTRYAIQSRWNYLVLLRAEDGTLLFHRHYPLSFPLPLALAPVILFVLALLFEFSPWGLGVTLPAYLLLLAGGNLILATKQIGQSLHNAFTTSAAVPGLLLVLLWFSLVRSRTENRKPAPRSPTHNNLNRILAIVSGIWNPAVFTVGGKVFLPFRGSVARIASFLDAQFLVICLSLYLLSIDLGNLQEFLWDSALLPRYFSLATMFFVILTFSMERRSRMVTNWSRVSLWKGALAVIVMEGIASQVAYLGSFPTLVRVGTALVLSEVLTPGPFVARIAARNFLPSAGMLLLATILTSVSVQSGIIDTVLVLAEPRIHPNAVALFTFIAGLFLGFLLGNLSLTFFTLYSVLIGSYDIALVRAALIDGILAGSLLSPFSIFNLLPSAQFGLKVQDMVKFRFRQLSLPLIIATLIYGVCAINSVAILQPVTFVFLVLVALAFQLKRTAWRIDRDTSGPAPHNAGH